MEWKNIDEICQPKQWKTLGINKLKEEGYPVYGANGIIGYFDEYNHEKDTLMITCRGATCGSINLSIGKSYINGNAMALDDLKNEEVNIKYLYYYLLQYDFKNIISGSAQPQITRTNLNNLKIPVPSLSVQKQIVDILDKAQELIDNRKRQIEYLDDLIESVFYEMFGDPVRNEMGWKVEHLSMFLDGIESGWSPRCKQQVAKERSWGVLKLSSVTGGTYKEYENKELPENVEPLIEYEIKEKDLLVTRKNTPELVGDIAYVFNTRSNLMLPDTIFRLKTKDTINKLYILHLFKNRRFKYKIKNLASGSAKSMSNISKSKLNDLLILAPSKQLQDKFSEKVLEIEKQKEVLKNSLKLMEDNYNSIMQKAFKGELF